MKLLIVTQVLDRNHPILGFFHRWVEEFAKHCERVHVICLEEGEHNLSSNVIVHSLGKEKGNGKIAYISNFYRLIFSLRKEYDGVFVHMNQIYVILGAPFWHILGKKVGLWYAHGSTPLTLKIAEKMTNIVFTSTTEGFRLKSNKVQIVGQGIDTGIFKSAEKEVSNVLRLITVGRVSPAKNIETLVDTCALLKERNVQFNFQIIGRPITDSEREYELSLKNLIAEKNLSKEVEWVGGVSNHELPRFLQQADIFIHDGGTNSLDKALLEAALCGCIVLSSNPAYKSLVLRTGAENVFFGPKGSAELATLIENSKNTEIKATSELIREFVKNNYGIDRLISGIVIKFQ